MNMKKFKLKKFKLKSIAKYAAWGLIAMFLVGSIPKSENWLRSRVMQLSSPHGLCSGEQVRAPSGIDYILTAAHCKILSEDGSIMVTTEDGRIMQRRVIAEDRNSDLLLLEGIPNMKGLDIADSASVRSHIRTFTHGKAHFTYMTEGEIMETRHVDIMINIIMDEKDEQACNLPKFKKIDAISFIGSIKICALSVDETTTQAKIVPGSSGGMVVNHKGELVGVVSAGDGDFGYLVTLDDIQTFLSNY